MHHINQLTAPSLHSHHIYILVIADADDRSIQLRRATAGGASISSDDILLPLLHHAPGQRNTSQPIDVQSCYQLYRQNSCQ